MIYTTQEELEAGLAKWQKILRLQDWDVKVQIARREQIGDKQGSCRPEVTLKVALIRILDPVDYPTTDWPQDHEETLVHELLHLHMEPLLFVVKDSDDELYQRLYLHYEQILSSLDRAFVEIDRCLKQ